MKKYYCEYNGIMKIKELNETGQKNRCQYEKDRNTYNSVRLYNSIEEAIKSLDGYSKETILPSNDIIIPCAYNYPKMEREFILKRVVFPIYETVANRKVC